jgi:hypothetical protein
MNDTQMNYVEGEVYFRITYPDAELLYPRVESFVFVGFNLSDEDVEDSWYFQFADSFARDGSVRTVGGGDRRVAVLTRDELSEMLALEQAIGELKDAERRRAARVTT